MRGLHHFTRHFPRSVPSSWKAVKSAMFLFRPFTAQSTVSFGVIRSSVLLALSCLLNLSVFCFNNVIVETVWTCSSCLVRMHCAQEARCWSCRLPFREGATT